MPESRLRELALLMAVNCVRNTVIEDYHAQGKLSDAEMKSFNQEVANKLYTFLHFLFGKSPEDQQAFLSAMTMMYPSNWDKPKLDRSFVEVTKQFKKFGNPLADNDR
jgi:hypothetical protein